METLESRIDGVRVIVMEKPATTSTILFAKIIKYFGTGIAKIINHVKSSMKSDENIDNVMEKEVDFSMFVDAINDISTKIDPEIFLALIQDITQGTRVQHPTNATEMIEVSNSTFDAVFTGRVMLMYKVVFLNLKVNYGDFLAIGGNGTIPAGQVPPVQSKKEK